MNQSAIHAVMSDAKYERERIPLQNTATRQEWASVLTSTWQKATAAFIQTGLGLIAAKEELPHGEFMVMIERELPFGPATAQKLMPIARKKVLSNPDYNQLLPSSWPTLYELTLFPDDILIAKIADGTINPKINCKEVIALRKSLLQEPIMTATQAARLAEINGRTTGVVAKKVGKRKFNGPKIEVPEGFSSLLSAARAGVELEKEGGNTNEASAKSKLSKQTYYVLRDVALLLERTDLSKKDRSLVERAEKQINEGQIAKSRKLVKPIVNKIWGIKGNRYKSDKKRTEGFASSILFVLTACTATAGVEVPYLDEERKQDALASMEEAIAALKTLASRIRRV